jgi:hypothetical protein
MAKDGHLQELSETEFFGKALCGSRISYPAG